MKRARSELTYRVAAALIALLFILTSVTASGGAARSARAASAAFSVLDGATIDITLYEFTGDVDGENISSLSYTDVTPVYSGNGIDVGASCFSYVYYEENGINYTASRAVLTVKFSSTFNYTSDCYVLCEGANSSIDGYLVTSDGVLGRGYWDNNTKLLELYQGVTQVDDVAAITICFTAEDTLNPAYLEIYVPALGSTDEPPEDNTDDTPEESGIDPTKYTNVLDDLQKDSDFSVDYYPENAEDYSLQVIQIAESSDNELFVYVYQPSGQAKNFTASSINISRTINDDISFYNYKLRLCNSDGVLYKYVVQNFTVLSVTTRYYAISSIYRPFNGDIGDEQADNDNTITEVEYDVSKQYCFSTINGKPYVSVVDIETIKITDKFVGFVRYSDGFKFYTSGACDSHFVAFSTDKPIDKLLEADVYYSSQSYGYSYYPGYGEHEGFGEITDNYAYLTYTQKVEHTGNGLFAGTYTWDRIETVEQFKAETNTYQNVYSGVLFNVSVENKITDEGIAALEGKQWVLRFAETEYSLSGGNGSTSHYYTLVGDVTILRLKFETDGITYNLGTIYNKQTGSNKPINDKNLNVSLTSRGRLLLLLLCIVIFLVLFIMFYPVCGVSKNAIGKNKSERGKSNGKKKKQ